MRARKRFWRRVKCCFGSCRMDKINYDPPLPVAVTGSTSELTARRRRTQVFRIRCARLQDVTVSHFEEQCGSYLHVSDYQPVYRFERFTVSRNCTLSVLWTTFTHPPIYCSLTYLSVLAHRPGLRRHRISRPFATCRGARQGHGP